MKIKMLPLCSIKPYPGNPRNNKAAVEKVKASLREFGFQQPLVLDANQVIIAGHTRYAAARELGLATVPCVIAAELSVEAAKAYRLADNKTAELAKWDMSMLSLELLDLKDSFDMQEFGFEHVFTAPPADLFEQVEPKDDDNREKTIEADESYYGSERDRTSIAYKLAKFNPVRAAGQYQLPLIKATQHIPKQLIGFNYLLSSEEYHKGVHFFLDDYQFERLWNQPQYYFDKLRAFDCVLTPDFSLYLDMPVAMKIWNVYRSRLLGQMMQDYDMNVIPTLSWAEEASFAYCFDGLEQGGVVAVSTLGVKGNANAMHIWQAGMAEALRRLSPETVLLYGGAVDFDFKTAKAVYLENKTTERLKHS